MQDFEREEFEGGGVISRPRYQFANADRLRNPPAEDAQRKLGLTKLDWLRYRRETRQVIESNSVVPRTLRHLRTQTRQTLPDNYPFAWTDVEPNIRHVCVTELIRRLPLLGRCEGRWLSTYLFSTFFFNRSNTIRAGRRTQGRTARAAGTGIILSFAMHTQWHTIATYTITEDEGLDVANAEETAPTAAATATVATGTTSTPSRGGNARRASNADATQSTLTTPRQTPRGNDVLSRVPPAVTQSASSSAGTVGRGGNMVRLRALLAAKPHTRFEEIFADLAAEWLHSTQSGLAAAAAAAAGPQPSPDAVCDLDVDGSGSSNNGDWPCENG